MGPAYRLEAAGKRDEYVAYPRSLCHRHDPVSVHRGFQCPHGIDLGDDRVSPHSLGPQGYALAAPSVPADHYVLACPENVGSPGDPIQGTLARSVTIVEEVLGVGVVDGDDRIFELARLSQTLQADHTCGCLLAPCQQPLQQLRSAGMESRHEIGAVVKGDVRFVVQGRADMPVVGVVVFAVYPVGDDPCGDQGRRNVVLSAQRVAGAQDHVGPTVPQGKGKVRRLGSEVQARNDPQVVQRLLPGKTLPDLTHYRHLLGGPLNA